MKIILAGPKGAGKSTIGEALAAQQQLPFFESDLHLERIYREERGETLHCREICRKEGEAAFRMWETRAVACLAQKDQCVISTGGSTLLSETNRHHLRPNATWVYLTASADLLWKRILPGGIPGYLTTDTPEAEYAGRVRQIEDQLRPLMDIIVDVGNRSPEEIVAGIQRDLKSQERTS